MPVAATVVAPLTLAPVFPLERSWLQSCTAPRPPKLMQVDWVGAPKVGFCPCAGMACVPNQRPRARPYPRVLACFVLRCVALEDAACCLRCRLVDVCVCVCVCVVQNRKMNAAVCPKFGGASVLQSQMVDLPHELEDTEVLLGERARPRMKRVPCACEAGQ